MLRLFVNVTILLCLLMGFAACSKQEFVPLQYSASGSSIGYTYIPAKIDIVVVPDNTPSIGEPFLPLTQEFSSFVTGLQGNYWDYHVMRSLLFQPSPINFALVDPQYNSSTM